jgi:hypothetical protein
MKGVGLMAGFEYSNSYVLKHILEVVPIKPNQLFYSIDDRNYFYHYDMSSYDILLANISKISEQLRLVGKIKNVNVSVAVVDGVCVFKVSKLSKPKLYVYRV